MSPGKLLILIISALVLLPIILVGIQVVNITSDSWYHLSQNLIGLYTRNSLIVVSGVALFTLLLGVYTAWWISMFDFPGRRFLQWGLILPLAIPTFINGITYSGITDYTGPIRVWSRSVGLGDIPLDILNIPGVIFVMAVVLFPYVYLSSRTVFALQSASHLESARLLGSSPSKVFFRVALPMAWPGNPGTENPQQDTHRPKGQPKARR